MSEMRYGCRHALTIIIASAGVTGIVFILLLSFVMLYAFWHVNLLIIYHCIS